MRVSTPGGAPEIAPSGRRFGRRHHPRAQLANDLPGGFGTIGRVRNVEVRERRSPALPRSLWHPAQCAIVPSSRPSGADPARWERAPDGQPAAPVEHADKPSDISQIATAATRALHLASVMWNAAGATPDHKYKGFRRFRRCR
jgi:hypothetical protein